MRLDTRTFVLPLAVLAWSLIGCESIPGSGGTDLDQVRQSLSEQFPDYNVTTDACEGMTWGGETEVSLALLAGHSGWAVLHVEGSPVCAGPVNALLDTYMALAGYGAEVQDLLDQLQRNGVVGTDASGSTGTIGSVFSSTFDPHPQPAVAGDPNSGIGSQSDPHPQPADSSDQKDRAQQAANAKLTAR